MKTINITYKKNNNDILFKNLEDLVNIKNCQNYIPIYDRFFKLTNINYNNINLNHNYLMYEILNKNTDANSFSCNIKDENNNIIKKNVFFKFSSLLDCFKYMLGKYDIEDSNLLNLPNFTNINSHEKTRDFNNNSYVDGFFSYLTSKLLHTHNFINGLDFYGAFIGVKDNFAIDVSDDMENLYSSDFFNNNKDKLFKFENIEDYSLLNFHSKNNKQRLLIENNIDIEDVITLDETINIEILTLNDFSSIAEIDFNINNTDNTTINDTYNIQKMDDSSSISSNSSNTTDDSHLSKSIKNNNDDDSENTNNNNDDDDNDDNDDDDDDTNSSNKSSDINDETNINVIINKIPVEIICLEKCTMTLDALMTTTKLSTDEWRSILFQIIITLITYQKVFKFTHNDLHTNNIMYIDTNITYLYYKYNNILYKIPTYGKIFKIIDYGRAIYSFKNELMCSDSYNKIGDATTQYNFGPYINAGKKIIEPNYSFDLCRLACSIYDFIYLDENEKLTEIRILIDEWCSDDKGRNILYKSSGEDRYIDFKLYKMIARSVHNHTPEAQLNKKIFSQYSVFKNKIKNITIINIDDIPTYY
jgi:hypothetical protein